MVSILDYYTTKFGELWQQSLSDLIKESVDGVLNSSGIEHKQIDAVFFGNMLAGILENNLHIPSKISDIMDLHIPVFRTEAACASGGAAFNLAYNYLIANPGKTVLVLGAEKMTDYSPEEVTNGLAAAASGEEQEAGLTFPGLYALIAQVYLATYGYTEEHLAAVAVKNHYHGSLNDKAQFRKKITLEQVLKSSYIAKPLKVLDCSPISDGASVVLLSSDKNAINNAKHKVSVLATEVATDTISLKKRRRLDRLEATVVAAGKAFQKAGISHKDISVAEVHDCFTIGELLAMEDLGFWKKGEAGAHMLDMETQFGTSTSLVVNTSGGLKAAGHPVGATGIKQIGELFLQLTGQAGERQVQNPTFGLAHNVGGSGGTAAVAILGT